MSYEFEKLKQELTIYDERMTAAAARLKKLYAWETNYKFVTDEQMVAMIPYTMMPRHYGHWSMGKQANDWRQRAKQGSFKIFEAVINSRPSYCYLSITNDLPRQLQVMAHARWGHVDFFANNFLFADTDPETVLTRFSRNANFVRALRDNPSWQDSAVDYILDAAHALQGFIGIIPKRKEQKSEKEYRQELTNRLHALRRQKDVTVGSFDRSQLDKQIDSLNNQLMHVPLRPMDDLLKFLMDPELNPNLPQEARELISIVREQSLYFEPQGETKVMNEGWANYWEQHLLLQPELDLPFAIGFELCKLWVGHQLQPIGWYTDPYALGRRVFDYIDQKYSYDELDENGQPIKDKVQVEIAEYDADGWLRKTGKFKTVEVVRRNRDKMFEVRRTYKDTRFLEEFLNTELFEQINLEALDWLQRVMTKINEVLRAVGYGPQMIFDPVPNKIEDKMKVIAFWFDRAQRATAGFNDAGTPVFPVDPGLLQQMVTVIQIIAGYDANKHAARRQLVLRTGNSWKPYIRVVDTGTRSDGYVTLVHTVDDNFGPLLQSECEDTLIFCRLLGRRPVRLLTKDFKKTSYGSTTKELTTYEYSTKNGEVVDHGIPMRDDAWFHNFGVEPPNLK